MTDPDGNTYKALDGTLLGINGGRMDERQRRQRLRLPREATCWDYAPLLDVIRRERGVSRFRFTGKSVAEWLSELRARNSPESEGFSRWYQATITPHLKLLSGRPRIPANVYSIEAARAPLQSSLPAMIRRLGMKRATPAHWAATLRGLTSKGVRPEELEASGLLVRLEQRPAQDTLSPDELIGWIDLQHVTPRLVSEARFGFATKAGWREVCQLVPARHYRRHRLSGTRDGGSWYVIRYRHRALGWSIVRCRHRDLFTRQADWWLVLDERGHPVRQAIDGFASLEAAFAHAERAINTAFDAMGHDQAMPKWERYSLPGSERYRELLIQLEDWPATYTPRHYRTRNVLVHLRTSLRETGDGRRVLYLDEIQSDWHADLHALGKIQGARPWPSTPDAPFRKEWPLLALKLMLWWARAQGLDGLAWSSAELQQARWGERGPPDILYRSRMPEAAQAIAGVLGLELALTRLCVRAFNRRVNAAIGGWHVCDGSHRPITKPFRERRQAEAFADMTGAFLQVDVPVLWFGALPPIVAVPIYGVGTADFWLNPTTHPTPFRETGT